MTAPAQTVDPATLSRYNDKRVNVTFQRPAKVQEDGGEGLSYAQVTREGGVETGSEIGLMC